VLVVCQPLSVLETLDPLSGLLAGNGGKLTSLLELDSCVGNLRELSVIDDKGKGTALFALVGMELDSAEGNSKPVSDPMPCLDVDL